MVARNGAANETTPCTRCGQPIWVVMCIKHNYNYTEGHAPTCYYMEHGQESHNHEGCKDPSKKVVTSSGWSGPDYVRNTSSYGAPERNPRSDRDQYGFGGRGFY